MSLFHTNSDSVPHLDRLAPPAAMPGGTVEIHGAHLEPAGHRVPHATIGDTPAPVTLSRPMQANVQVPDGSVSGDLVLHSDGNRSNPLRLRVAVPMAENLHPVANPAVDANGQVFATLSGTRGQAVPVSIFRIQHDFQMTPFVRDLMNPTGLAFDRQGYLYASSRAEGTIYRITPEGEVSTFAEGMGIATGLAFDERWNLYVGDRSGTIFKINPEREIFVFATLEPSIAAYHLAFNSTGTLFVSGPTTSSNQAIHAIDR
ncbi:MAG: gluconolaconase, partial [Acidobacteriaceae bacterium]|nr:gluconolaconase [Acidobacteriaceae bacterium]